LLSSFLTIESVSVSPLLIKGCAFCGLGATTFLAREAPSRPIACAAAFCSPKRWPPKGAAVFAKACEPGLEGIVSKRAGSAAEPQLAEDEEPELRQDVTRVVGLETSGSNPKRPSESTSRLPIAQATFSSLSRLAFLVRPDSQYRMVVSWTPDLAEIV
jgi:hypothetical protein